MVFRNTFNSVTVWAGFRAGMGHPVGRLQGDSSWPGRSLDAGSLTVTSGTKQQRLISADTDYVNMYSL